MFAPVAAAGQDVRTLASATAAAAPAEEKALSGGSKSPGSTSESGESQVPPPVPVDPPGDEQAGLMGDLGGARRELSDLGVKVGATAVVDFSRVGRVGNPTAFASRVLLDARAELDFGRLFGLPRVSGFVQYYGKTGHNGSEFASDVQGFSNIDAPSFRDLGEVWLEASLPGEAARVKVGRIDANSEFASLHSSEQFVNSSMGFSPTIWGLPTYPDPRRGLVVASSRPGWLDVSAGVFERTVADPDRPNREHRAGWLWMGQVRAKWELRPGLDGTASVGAWRHTGHIDTLDGGSQGSASGPFVTAEQTVWREAGRQAGDETSQHLHVFLQYGTASAVVSEVSRHVGGGMALRAPFRSRRDDMLGLGATHVRLSRTASDQGGSELSVGPFYLARLRPWLAIQPDLQWLVHRVEGVASAVSPVLTCRVEVEF